MATSPPVAKPPSYVRLMRYHRYLDDLLADDGVRGDMLLVAMWLGRAVHLNVPVRVEGEGWSAQQMCIDLFGGRRGFNPFVEVLRNDRPRYDPDLDPVNADYRPHWGPCGAAMIRREGLCGQAATNHGLATDLTTGHRYRIRACARHKPWYDKTIIENKEAVAATTVPVPVPAQNTGGLLDRHLPELNWDALYVWAVPKWTPPPATGQKVVKPKLQLFTTPIIDPDDRPRPRLTSVKGGRP